MGAEAIPGERALEIRFERGGVATSLQLELFGRQANLYLVDRDGTVLLTPRGSIASAREASVGSSFTPTAPDPSRIEPAPPIETTASEVVEAMAEAGTGDDSLERARTRVRRALNRLRKATAKRIASAEHQLARAGDAEAWRQKGELLRASFHLLKPGLASVRVTDYMQDPPVEVDIELDPSRDPGDQVAHCFARAKKLERSAEHARATIDETRAEHGSLERVLASLDDAGSIDALSELVEELPDRARKEAERAITPTDPHARKRPARRVPWREYESIEGWAIRVGKSARDNDELTLRASKPNDLFLHVRGAQGSHVIVPTPRGKTVPKETLLDAAELACLFSSRDEAERNEVDYAERRHVRKAKGAPPGLVIVERAKTLAVRKDDARRQRLLASRRDQTR